MPCWLYCILFYQYSVKQRKKLSRQAILPHEPLCQQEPFWMLFFSCHDSHTALKLQ
jgi:hypothetical protein